MTLLQLVVLALIQGLTEFLPVSSSAHLILGSKLFQWPDQGLVFDVATHVGTLLAVLFYFRKMIWALVSAWLQPAETPEMRRDRDLGKFLVLASIPVIVVGGLAGGWVETYLRDVRIIAASTLLFGLLLWLADAFFGRSRKLEEMTLGSAVAIGIAQVFALIPGASRSGVTITMGRMLGFGAEDAARFSFLLAIPVISAAGAYGLLRMWQDSAGIDWAMFALAIGASSVAGWVCIAAFLALLRRVGLVPFVIYRLILGGVLLYLAW
jgi:undecaprenyl-diphosphatase